MSTDTTQVMRVVDRCLDTAHTGSTGSTGTDLAAAAARARTDPAMRKVISGLLTADGDTRHWTRWRHAMSSVREAGTADCLFCTADDSESPDEHIYTFTVTECKAAPDSGRPTPLATLFTRCTIATQELAQPCNQTARILFQLILTAVAVERSTLGEPRARRLRSAVPTADITSTLRRSERI